MLNVYYNFFEYSDYYDIVCMIAGTIGALLTGLGMPYSEIIFGQTLDALNKDSKEFANNILYLVYSFVVLGCIVLIGGYIQVKVSYRK